MNNKQRLDKILKDIYAAMREDKLKMVKFCLKKGHTITDMAKAMGTSREALSQFITRYKLK